MGVAEPDLGGLSAPEPLSDRHDIAGFISGESSLDDWLRRRAAPNQLSGVSRTYVVTHGRKVIGYYSLAAGAVALNEAVGRLRRNMPDPIPMTILGRLAIDRAWQGKGIGRLLLRDAVIRTLQAAQAIGIRGLLVHALTPQAKRFYEQAGFRESPDNPMTLMISLQDAAAALGTG